MGDNTCAHLKRDHFDGDTVQYECALCPPLWYSMRMRYCMIHQYLNCRSPNGTEFRPDPATLRPAAWPEYPINEVPSSCGVVWCGIVIMTAGVRAETSATSLQG
jgi:hypothetical protein